MITDEQLHAALTADINPNDFVLSEPLARLALLVRASLPADERDEFDCRTIAEAAMLTAFSLRANALMPDLSGPGDDGSWGWTHLGDGVIRCPRLSGPAFEIRVPAELAESFLALQPLLAASEMIRSRLGEAFIAAGATKARTRAVLDRAFDARGKEDTKLTT